MLILEGPDCVGKTVFAQKCVALRNKLFDECNCPWPAVYQHFTKLPSRWDYYNNYLPYMQWNTVSDRFHISELVYGEVFRNGSKIDVNTLNKLEIYRQALGGYTVAIVCETDDILRERFERVSSTRTEMFSNVSKMIQVNNGYKEIISCTNLIDCCIMIKDSTSYPSEQAVEQVVLTWIAKQVQKMNYGKPLN